MAYSGMDIVRLNFSFSTHEDHLKHITLIRKINKKYNKRIEILQDLEGYRIRVGRLKKRILLKEGKLVWLIKSPVQEDTDTIPINYEDVLKRLKLGDYIYINDGALVLKVRQKKGDRVGTIVLRGGQLDENKGINIPTAKLTFLEDLREKDRKDIIFGIENEVDYIAQSFVRRKEDIWNIKNMIKDKLPRCKVIAKIESREGVQNIDEIIEVSDGIMIARGDLGISFPIYQVPILQKDIVKKCKKKGKFVIIATQMLESMRNNLLPTRAEVSDVANAILDGADYLLLSAETAVGRYPVKVVEMMRQIIEFVDKSKRIKKK
jgi:pyruvate kinase